MRFAKIVFLVAGVYGLLVLLPQYFLIGRMGHDYPPPVNHPEYYYGFVGVGVAWQLLFLVLSRDPARYRPVMIPAVVEKASFGIAATWLYLEGRAPAAIFGGAVVDLLLGALFVAAFLKTPALRGQAGG